MNISEIKTKKNNDKIDVSIIIRTFNEELYIEECINRILNQKTKYLYEIILIDSESLDRTIEKASKYDISIVKIKKSDFNFGTSINLGIEKSRGKYCVFLSAHAYPQDEYWLEYLVDACAGNRVAGSYSRQEYDENASVIEARGLSNKFGEKKKVQSFDDFIKVHNRKPNKFFEYRKYITFSNASSCINKEVASKIKFKEILASEDREWALRVLHKDYNIVYEPKSRVLHYHNEDLQKWYNRIFINAKSLKEFSGYKYKKYMTFPIIFINIIRDILFLKKIKRRVNIFDQIIVSFNYWKVYCDAYYKATN